MSEWVPIGTSWLGHRPEPLIHERLWACPLIGDGPYQGLIDEHGRGLVYRQDGGYEERTTYEADRVVVEGIVTTFIVDGRPVRSVYTNGEEERYHYDGERLVAIDEAPTLWDTAIGSARYDTGGRLEISYDDRGLRAIEGVWTRLDEPWPDALARGATEIAAKVVEDIKRVIEEPVDGVVSLTLGYVQDGGGVLDSVSLNRSRDHNSVFYPYGREWPIGEIDSGVDQATEALWMSNAALNSIELPNRTLLNAVAAILARYDWTGIFTPTDDFVTFIAEHDEGYAEKVESLRAANPPERAEPWIRLLEKAEPYEF
ncbi:hypothetical protein C8N24_6403 [Solirubrobacter pauli]|uniref:Uncharacterized protein n=1 Tax=Solirubrobacter pauli TaxID=166793 RepID=A0A660L2Y4_9ACTN|nr:hypothetical protein [Solirubrobacter pauli]RKQ88361.1 hypothetical protein C8N24_6403 [Solirubrobacter pauli]